VPEVREADDHLVDPDRGQCRHPLGVVLDGGGVDRGGVPIRIQVSRPEPLDQRPQLGAVVPRAAT
jgi:hypothetical protein